eukprot:gnl/TRDRNA2_/TRDRNA2_27788_c0_seq1.p1 gnl/TRDRNA2_/TRDRNA2_27788_c0~~gnl/TRDRNA2_/TRDRNA2_27788_c0_seq1.p1  ORF type:complete len:530 (+),score=73.77 gnl/TRDRNA2_/TRDRNA2_27788_c0_seq1:110-1699(+)
MVHLPEGLLLCVILLVLLPICLTKRGEEWEERSLHDDQEEWLDWKAVDAKSALQHLEAATNPGSIDPGAQIVQIFADPEWSDEEPDDDWPRGWSTVHAASQLEQLNGGTQPVKIEIDGALYVRKSLGGDLQQAAMEELVNKLYSVVGVPAPNCRLYIPPPAYVFNSTYLLCQWLQDIRPLELSEVNASQPLKEKLAQHYVLDAVLGNYDLGRNDGNIGIDAKGNVVRIDNGGALAVRANGGWKVTEYECFRAREWRVRTWPTLPYTVWDMRKGLSNYVLEDKVDVYAGLTAQDIQKQAYEVKAKEEDMLDSISENCPAIKEYLHSRIECMSRLADQTPDIFEIDAEEENLQETICSGVASICGDLVLDIPEYALPEGLHLDSCTKRHDETALDGEGLWRIAKRRGRRSKRRGSRGAPSSSLERLNSVNPAQAETLSGLQRSPERPQDNAAQAETASGLERSWESLRTVSTAQVDASGLQRLKLAAPALHAVSMPELLLGVVVGSSFVASIVSYSRRGRRETSEEPLLAS